MLVLCVLTSGLSFVSILDCICHQCLTLIIYHVTSLLVILYLSTVHCVCLFKLFVCIFNFLLPPVVNKDVHCIFTVALGYAIARLGYRRRPSVCPSVRPSQAGTMWKQTVTWSRGFHHRIAQGLYFLDRFSYIRWQELLTPNPNSNPGKRRMEKPYVSN